MGTGDGARTQGPTHRRPLGRDAPSLRGRACRKRVQSVSGACPQRDGDRDDDVSSSHLKGAQRPVQGVTGAIPIQVRDRLAWAERVNPIYWEVRTPLGSFTTTDRRHVADVRTAIGRLSCDGRATVVTRTSRCSREVSTAAAMTTLAGTTPAAAAGFASFARISCHWQPDVQHVRTARHGDGQFEGGVITTRGRTPSKSSAGTPVRAHGCHHRVLGMVQPQHARGLRSGAYRATTPSVRRLRKGRDRPWPSPTTGCTRPSGPPSPATVQASTT